VLARRDKRPRRIRLWSRLYRSTMASAPFCRGNLRGMRSAVISCVRRRSDPFLDPDARLRAPVAAPAMLPKPEPHIRFAGGEDELPSAIVIAGASTRPRTNTAERLTAAEQL
jgi:hypothetical protein